MTNEPKLDLVHELRRPHHPEFLLGNGGEQLLAEAADEIERLRKGGARTVYVLECHPGPGDPYAFVAPFVSIDDAKAHVQQGHDVAPDAWTYREATNEHIVTAKGAEWVITAHPVLGERHEKQGRPFAELRDTGLLWAINRHVFHPRGLALGLHFEDESEDPQGEPTGWSILYAGDGQVYAFTEEDDDEQFRRFEAFLRGLEFSPVRRIVSALERTLNVTDRAMKQTPPGDAKLELFAAVYEDVERIVCGANGHPIPDGEDACRCGQEGRPPE